MSKIEVLQRLTVSAIPLSYPSSAVQECSVLGIEGNDIEKELHGLTKDLPNTLFEAANKVKSEAVRSAVDFYAEFTRHVSKSRADAAELLPTLTEIQAAELLLPEGGENDSLTTAGSITEQSVPQQTLLSLLGNA